MSTLKSEGQAALLETALKAHDAGLSVIRFNSDGSKIPIGAWTQYQTQQADRDTVEHWFRHDNAFLGLACGYGGVECIDIDASDTINPYFKLVRHTMGSDELLRRLYIEKTKRGGLHLLYRVDPRDGDAVARNQKLAIRRTGESEDGTLDISTLIETRAMGGAVIIAPSEGYRASPQCAIDAIPVITGDERDILIKSAMALTEHLEPERIAHAGTTATTDGNRPGDDYNRRGDVIELLERHDWLVMRGDETSEKRWLRRPGKHEGSWSATYHNDLRLLYVFSSNAYPFDCERAHMPFGVFALLEHDGDFVAAAGALARRGFGDPDYVPDVASKLKGDKADSSSHDMTKAQASPTQAPKRRSAKREIVSMSATTKRFDEINERKIEWECEGWSARRKYHVVAGEGGVGKTSMMIDLAARRSRGANWPDGTPGVKGRTLFVCSEDDAEDTIKPALRAAGADMSMIEFLVGVEVVYDNGDVVIEPFNIGQHMEALEKKIADGDFAAVILDSLNDMLPVGTKLNDPVAYRHAIQPLRDLAATQEIAVFVVTHLNKQPGQQANHRVGGTEAVVSSARLVWMVVAVPDSDDGVNGPVRVVQVTKSNVGLLPKPLKWNRPKDGALNWLGESEQTVDQILRESAHSNDHGAGNANDQMKIVMLLAKENRLMTAAEVAPVLEKSEEAARKQMGRMVQSGTLVKPVRGKYGLVNRDYSISDETDTPSDGDTDVSECPDVHSDPETSTLDARSDSIANPETSTLDAGSASITGEQQPNVDEENA